MTIAAFDIVCAVLMLILVVRCALRGFIDEVMSMASVVLGVMLALFFYKNGADFIREKWISMKVVPEILSFAAIFLIVFLVVRFVEYLLKDIIEGINLHGLDRFLGVLFGILEGFVLIGLILFILVIQPLFDPSPIFHNSYVAKFLLPLVTNVQVSVFKMTAL